VLQMARFGWLDASIGEVAETGRHAVHGGTGGDELFDDFPTGEHPITSCRGESDRGVPLRHQLDILDPEIEPGKLEGVSHRVENSQSSGGRRSRLTAQYRAAPATNVTVMNASVVTSTSCVLIRSAPRHADDATDVRQIVGQSEHRP
jgi:hypothetical protein